MVSAEPLPRPPEPSRVRAVFTVAVLYYSTRSPGGVKTQKKKCGAPFVHRHHRAQCYCIAIGDVEIASAQWIADRSRRHACVIHGALRQQFAFLGSSA